MEYIWYLQDLDEQQSSLEELTQRYQRLEQEKEDVKCNMAVLKKDWEKERKNRVELDAKTAELIRMSVCLSVCKCIIESACGVSQLCVVHVGMST